MLSITPFRRFQIHVFLRKHWKCQALTRKPRNTALYKAVCTVFRILYMTAIILYFYILRLRLIKKKGPNCAIEILEFFDFLQNLFQPSLFSVNSDDQFPLFLTEPLFNWHFIKFISTLPPTHPLKLHQESFSQKLQKKESCFLSLTSSTTASTVYPTTFPLTPVILLIAQESCYITRWTGPNHTLKTSSLLCVSSLWLT